jgi:putative ABC transport system permease protein
MKLRKLIDHREYLSNVFLLIALTHAPACILVGGSKKPITAMTAEIATQLWQDLKYAFRMLWKYRGFTAASVLTLALGIGGNTAIFSITNAVLLKSFPYEDPDHLVMVQVQRQSTGGQGGNLTLNHYDLVRERNHSFDGIAVWTIDTLNLTGRGEPQQVAVTRISPNFFRVLGISPRKGRTFLDEEGQPAGKPVVLISDALWHSHFGGDPDIVGKTLTLDSMPYTIVGVLPAIQFPFVGPTDVWSPRYFELSLMTPEHLRGGVGYLSAVARLKPGSSAKSASAELQVLHQQYSQEFPKAPDAGSDVVLIAGGLQELTVANIHRLLMILSVAVGLVLLIACANVASLLLSRALARSKEIAIRTALGASRPTIIRQLLTESIVLAFVSGAFGLALGIWSTRLLVRFGASYLPQGFDVSPDSRVLIFTLTISLATGLLFGIFPALKLATTNVNSELHDESRGSTGGHRRVQVKNLLVVSQIALSVVLLVAATLMIRSFDHLRRVDLGVDPNNLITMNVSLPATKYAKKEQQVAFFDELLRKLNAVPGVQSASISAALPLNARRITPMLPEGQPEVPLAQRPFIIIEAIGTDWFRTMRVPLQLGRTFSDHDTADAPRVLIVNQSFARHYWPNENAIGKHVAVGRQPSSEVVGVVADVRNSGLAIEPQPQAYIPFPQLPWTSMNLIVRTASDPHPMIATLRQQVYSLDPDQPVTAIQTIDELAESSRSQSRFTTLLLTALSSIALILAVVGIYGVLAYMVAQRRPEIGIRLALGAKSEHILQLILSHGLFLVGTGILLGLVLSIISTRLMTSLLFGVKPTDITSLVLTPLLLLLSGMLASYLPAQQATKVDPSELFRAN